MAFVPIGRAPRLRRWLLWGFAEDGKSTFAAQFRRPALVIDSDHRFGEVAALAGEDIFALSSVPEDAHDVLRIRDGAQ